MSEPSHGVKPVHLIGVAITVITFVGGLWLLVKLDDWRLTQLEKDVAALQGNVQALQVRDAVHEERSRCR